MVGNIYKLLCLVVLCKGININSLKLEQVLILSRHNLRTPLTADLKQYTTKTWPKWDDPSGYLTQKGATLEGYMGQYIAEWLENENFIEGCPKENKVLIYANTKSRTLATAKAFSESAFRGCNIPVQHQENLEKFDPIFLPIFHNKTESFKNQIAEEMGSKLKEMNLTQSYMELNRILNIENSDICKKLFLCDLTLGKTEIVNEDGEEPDVSGPLFIGNAIVDSFLMSYYEGTPIENVAWGQIKTDDQWRLLTKISRENQNVRFNLTSGSKDLAGPLLKFMFHIFENRSPKFTLLVGHDSNLNPVVNALGFKSFELPHQFEPFPIGGKIVFQKWVDDDNTYLKVEYIYPSTSQLRNGHKLSLFRPPQKVLLELKGCEVSANGYCPWSDFMKLDVY